MDEMGCIGRNNQLPWRLSADLRRFKALTMGHHLIMGRKTYESIGRALPGRQSIIVTHQPGYFAPGCLISNSLEDALRIAENAGENEVFIIGGAQIFRQALPFVERIYMTLIHAQFACEVYFPVYDPGQWNIVSTEFISDDPSFSHTYSFLTLIRNTEITPQ